MNIRNELKQVTNEIAAARENLAMTEATRLLRRRNVTQVEAALNTARIALMSRTEAGSNDAQRRAYAERETAPEREHLERLESNLLDSELEIISFAAHLRILEDRRRYLETIVRIMVSDAADLLQFAYADSEAPAAVIDENAPPF